MQRLQCFCTVCNRRNCIRSALVPDVLELVVTFLPDNDDLYFHNFYLLQQEISSILGLAVELTDWDQLKNQVVKKRILEHSEVMYNHSIERGI